MKILLILILGIVIPQNNLESDMVNSMVKWSGSAAFSNYKQEGTLRLKQMDFKTAQNKINYLNVVANMRSLSNEDGNLTNHLRSEDFFDSNKYPTASFQSTDIIPLHHKSKGYIKGILKIKDRARVISFKYEVSNMRERIILSISGDFNRTDFNVNHNSPSVFKDLKDNAISDKIEFQTKLHFIKSE